MEENWNDSLRLSAHHGLKLDSNKGKFKTHRNWTAHYWWKWIKTEIKMESKNFLELNENESTTYPNEGVLRGKRISQAPTF